LLAFLALEHRVVAARVCPRALRDRAEPVDADLGNADLAAEFVVPARDEVNLAAERVEGLSLLHI